MNNIALFHWLVSPRLDYVLFYCSEMSGNTSHLVNSHFVNSNLVNIDKVGVDKVGVDKVGVDPKKVSNSD